MENTMKDKLLQAKGPELSRMLGEVLGDGKHVITGFFPEHHCSKCFRFEPLRSGYSDRCSPPIPLDDWNVAMKFMVLSIELYGEETWHDAIIAVLEADSITGAFAHLQCKQRHILIASAQCKLNAEEREGK